MPRDQKPVAGSHRTPFRNAKPVGKVAADQRVEVTLRVRPRKADTDSRAAVMAMGAKRPSERSYLSREDLGATRGADPEDLARIDQFAHTYNLTVVETSVPKRTVRLSGTVADLSRAFGVQLQKYKSKEVVYRGRTGPVYVPSELADIVEGVFGLDNRPVAKPHFRRLESPAGKRKQTGAHRGVGKGKAGKTSSVGRAAAPRNAADGSFAVPEVAQLYNFPAGLDGTGQCIAIIELNDFDQNGTITGTGYSLSDLQTFFGNLGLATPDVSAIGVDGGANMPGPDPNSDGEVTLDVEVAGAVAPGAKIAVYFAPNTDAGFIDAVNAALHDTVRRPAVISISWGGPEDASTDQFLNGLNQAFQDAASIGMTVCCAAGDDGSSDEPPDTRDGQPHADFPSSSPFALACGGTKLIGAGTTIGSEVVWNEGDGPGNGAGGGGVSNKFARPDYQNNASVPVSPLGNTGRGVPDVAGNADPHTGYRVIVGGQEFPIGGTSAVAPLWAGLLALMNQSLTGKGGNTVGFWNPLIYGSLAGTAAFRDITQGNNDIDGALHKYSAGPGWDACTGMGSPNGAQILQAL
ncbi:MAG TPA: S53 family peptidase [Terriglobia bacterium]|nr:S53 family peptidase [Terriglobia bacterium]